ncbi:peptide ABC transporter substrate-binding protein [Nocardioides sp. LHD-245]|uniref:peptide ABC transporter substrate-binding protein n=1 Tax=Nocardioides sp. LHD-245 TaxID=3051387 RepID=UPI0027DF7728|nr:peptide ABC transporter substrate-binding protein [Nocardioides sp. LHD-245]
MSLIRRSGRGPVRAAGALAVIATLALTSCSFSDDPKKEDGAQVLTVGVGAPIDSLDPHFINNGGYVVPAGLLEGLVAQNDAGDDVVPAIASEWTESEDGLTYLFTIRDDAMFSNGDPITAESVVANFQRLLTPTGSGGGNTANANAYQVGLGIENATEFQTGEVSDWSQVGISAPDASSVEITLDAPNPDFLLGMTDNSMLIVDTAAIEKNPKDWTKAENWVGSGAYTVKSWDPTTGMDLVPNEHYWDRDNVTLDEIDIRVIQDPQAAILAYQNDEVDVTLVTLDLISNDEALLEEVEQADGYAIDFLNLQYSTHPAAQDERVRQALSLAIDREKLASVQVGTTPSSSLVPRRVEGWTESMATSVYDPERAADLLAEAGYPGGEGLPEIQIFDHRPRPVSDAIVEMWKAIGIDAKVNIVDIGVWADTRWNVLDDDKMGYYINSFGGIPTLNNWLYTFWGPETTKQFSLPAGAWKRYESIQTDEALDGAAKSRKLAEILDSESSAGARQFAELVERAREAVDPAERTALYVEAATLRESLGEQIPILEEPQAFLVKPSVEGVNVRTTIEGFYFKGVSIS